MPNYSYMIAPTLGTTVDFAFIFRLSVKVHLSSLKIFILFSFLRYYCWNYDETSASRGKMVRPNFSRLAWLSNTSDVNLDWFVRLFFWSWVSLGAVLDRGGVLEDVLGLEVTFLSPWPWPRSLKSSKNWPVLGSRTALFFIGGHKSVNR